MVCRNIRSRPATAMSRPSTAFNRPWSGRSLRTPGAVSPTFPINENPPPNQEQMPIADLEDGPQIIQVNKSFILSNCFINLQK